MDYKLNPSQVTVSIYEKVSDTRNLTVDILHKDNLDKKLSIDNVELDRNDVIIKGAAYKLKKVATVKALVDVNNIVNPKAGEMTLKDVPLVAYDTNGKVVDVEVVPKKVDAKITITSPSKEVPIKVVPKGNLAFGKAISYIDTSISKVTIYGDEAAVDKIDSLKVEVDVKGLSSSKEYNVTLKKPKGITALSAKTITVKVGIDNSATKEFENVPISTEHLDSRYKAQALSENDIKVTVVVKGSKEILDKFDASSIHAYINLKNYGVGEHEVPVKVTGDDLKLKYTPKTKKVRIKISEK